MQTV
ncbi:unnamed protein product, partial [Allacma fusca]